MWELVLTTNKEQEAKEIIDRWYANEKSSVKPWSAIILFLSGVACAAYFKDTDDIIIRSYAGAYLGFSWALSFLFWGLIHIERGYITGRGATRYYRKEHPSKFVFLFLFQIALPLIGMLLVGVINASAVI